MAFYDMPKIERDNFVALILYAIGQDIFERKTEGILKYFADEDTYVRKSAYLAVGKIYLSDKLLLNNILYVLNELFVCEKEKVRQTVVNAAGEIGKTDFSAVQKFFDTGLFDEHHSVRNAVIGSMKKMGEKNPQPVLEWSRKYLHHPDKEIRREICHGIELRGRTHPQDILPLLRELQFDKTHRVRSTLIHVLGQIAYKRGCLEKVVADLLKWENKELVTSALEEIINVHYRYRNFAFYTQEQARTVIAQMCA